MTKIPFLFLALSSLATLPAYAAGAPGGELVIGHGRGPGGGESVAGDCVSPEIVRASVEAAEAAADRDAAAKCDSGRAQRAGDYRIEAGCIVWNSVFPGAKAQAAYVCEYR